MECRAHAVISAQGPMSGQQFDVAVDPHSAFKVTLCQDAGFMMGSANVEKILCSKTAETQGLN